MAQNHGGWQAVKADGCTGGSTNGNTNGGGADRQMIARMIAAQIAAPSSGARTITAAGRSGA